MCLNHLRETQGSGLAGPWLVGTVVGAAGGAAALIITKTRRVFTHHGKVTANHKKHKLSPPPPSLSNYVFAMPIRINQSLQLCQGGPVAPPADVKGHLKPTKPFEILRYI